MFLSDAITSTCDFSVGSLDLSFQISNSKMIFCHVLYILPEILGYWIEIYEIYDVIDRPGRTGRISRTVNDKKDQVE